MRRQLIFRIRLITGAILLLSLILLGRLYQIQILDHDHYVEKAEKQYVHTERDLYTRGSIYFTTKEGQKFSAASVKSGYLLAFNPTLITDARKVCEAVAPLISYDLEKCVERATLPERTYVEIITTLNKEQQEKISALKFAGVHLYRNQWRYYPGDSLAARSIGFIGYTSDDDKELHGKYGLERYYDDLLLRQNQVRTVNLFAEIFSNLGDLVYRQEHFKPGDVVTTLEPTISRKLDSVLAKVHEKYQSKLTGAIIMNPKTGAIYALNAIPSFDLNSRGSTTIEEFQNPLVENVYEFGSTIKALTMAAGIDSGAVNSKSTYYDAGFIDLDTFTIKNYDGKGRGTVDMQTVLNQSLNTGVSYIVQKMGKEKFREYFLNFKLGSETGIDLPNEALGLVDNLNSPRQVEYATASFGQGIAISPIAAARALAVLGNGGYLVTPHLATRLEYQDGSFAEKLYPPGAQVISKESSEEISRMLVHVVDHALVHGKQSMPNHTIAAKTGTAQIADPNGKGYYEDRYLHSFFGYFPAYDPQFLVFLYTVEPKGVQYASETLTEPFFDMTKFLINYYSIPPDR